MARFGPRPDGPPIFGPGRANLQAQNRAKMGRRALSGPWKTGPGRAKTGRATARPKPSTVFLFRTYQIWPKYSHTKYIVLT